MLRSVLMGVLVVLISGCDPSVRIGDPTDAGSGGGGGAVVGGGGGTAMGGGGGATGGGGGAIGGGGGGVTGGGGGAATGGGSATGGGGGGALNAMGCPGSLSCADVTGQNDFACVQGTSVPANSPACSNNTPCATGSTCYLTSTTSSTGVCLLNCPGTGGGAGGGGGGGGGGNTGGGGGTAAPLEPVFVSATPPTINQQPLKLTLTFPTSQPGDFLIALIGVDEGSGAQTITTPAGWTLQGGWPIHNLNSQHTPYIIPVTQNHGTWIFTHFVVAGETPSVELAFGATALARGALVAYRGVNTLTPVHDKTGYGLYGNGDTNGFGAGNTTLNAGTQVSLIATSTTQRATYTTVYETGGITERVNSGENPNGLNLIIHDDTIYPRLYFAPNVRHFQSPSGSSDSFMYSIATLVLTPL